MIWLPIWLTLCRFQIPFTYIITIDSFKTSEMGLGDQTSDITTPPIVLSKSFVLFMACMNKLYVNEILFLKN